MEKLNGYYSDLTNCCSVMELGSWSNPTGKYGYSTSQKDLETEAKDSIGFAVTTFIDNEDNHEAYKWLAARYKLAYQSPVRNGRHDRGCFIAIWDLLPNKKEVTK